MRHLSDADNLTAQRIVEAREAVDQLRYQGYGQLLDAVSDPSALTQAGQIKVAAVARLTGQSPLRVSMQIQTIRRGF